MYARCREDIGGPNNFLLLVGLYFIPVLSTPLIPNYDRAVCLKECNISKSKAGEDSFVLPKDVQTLYIEHCYDFSNLCDIASLKTATKLSTCYIDSCHGIKHVICTCSCSLPLIRSLESLHLEYLSELSALVGREICCAFASSQQLQTAIFSSLKEFVIIGCPKLKRLFRPVFLSHLKHLQALRVEDCEEMVEMIGEALDDDENQEPVSTSIIFSLPKLSHLQLVCLPELKRFCSRELVFDSLNVLYTKGCPKLSFNGQHVESDTSKTDYRVLNSRIVQHDF